jgi:ferredoxin
MSAGAPGEPADGEVYVNKAECVGSGSCVAVAPHAFRLDAEGHAEVYAAFAADDLDVQLAVEQCPVEAIHKRGHEPT